ncbi:hypothetical protein [Bradyrhizobium jicamae]|nr:hypothetical protein [Bradyrhizobium jicamae]
MAGRVPLTREEGNIAFASFKQAGTATLANPTAIKNVLHRRDEETREQGI